MNVERSLEILNVNFWTDLISWTETSLLVVAPASVFAAAAIVVVVAIVSATVVVCCCRCCSCCWWCYCCCSCCYCFCGSSFHCWIFLTLLFPYLSYHMHSCPFKVPHFGGSPPLWPQIHEAPPHKGRCGGYHGAENATDHSGRMTKATTTTTTLLHSSTAIFLIFSL